MVRTATPRLEVWFSQPLWPDPIERGAASSQHAAREQDCANQDCDQHGAHDTEPFLVGRRVGDFAFKNFPHRPHPLENHLGPPRSRGLFVGKKWAKIVERGTKRQKTGGVYFLVQKAMGPPSFIGGGPETSAAARRSAI